MSHSLSKSSFISGTQCVLRLWNESAHPELATPADSETQARMEAGHELGIVARGRFPGQLVQAKSTNEALLETARLMADPAVHAIYEAAFSHKGALARVDILVRQDAAWDIVEAKSVVQEKDVHLLDAAYQRWVVIGSGVPVRGTSVMRLNRDYKFDGVTLDLDALFLVEDVSEAAGKMHESIEVEVARLQAILQSEDGPCEKPGHHCLEPYECPFMAHCTKDWPVVEDPVDWMLGVGAKKAMTHRTAGIHRMSELPTGKMKPNHLQVLACHREKKNWISGGLKEALGVFQYPIHFMDFETYATPLPVIAGSGPYEAVPVQWSCHSDDGAGTLTHREYLADGFGDPREDFALSLLAAIGTEGSICVYSSYEKSILGKLAAALPHLAPAIEAAIERLVDLLPIVKEHVYMPPFHGSYSIKKVLPALVPGFNYDSLAVQNGLQAMEAFREMLDETDPVRRKTLRDNLLIYCGQDTLAMVKVLEAMTKLSPT